jgi:hypothetical protein
MLLLLSSSTVRAGLHNNSETAQVSSSGSSSSGSTSTGCSSGSTSVLAQLYVTVVYNYCHCAIATVYRGALYHCCYSYSNRFNTTATTRYYTSQQAYSAAPPLLLLPLWLASSLSTTGTTVVITGSVTFNTAVCTAAVCCVF